MSPDSPQRVRGVPTLKTRSEAIPSCTASPRWISPWTGVVAIRSGDSGNEEMGWTRFVSAAFAVSGRFDGKPFSESRSYVGGPPILANNGSLIPKPRSDTEKYCPPHAIKGAVFFVFSLALSLSFSFALSLSLCLFSLALSLSLCT